MRITITGTIMIITSMLMSITTTTIITTTMRITVTVTPKARLATTWSIRARLRVRSPGER